MSEMLEIMNEAQKKEFWASLALRHIQGLGVRSHKKLLAFFGSAHSAVSNIDRWAEVGISADKIEAARSEAWREYAMPEWKAAQRFSGHIILWTSPDYPRLLRELPDPPLILYATGNISLLKSPSIAVVGARHCTEEGLRVGGSIAAKLAASGITIVSGMAIGIDSQAHRVALARAGSSIAVLGCGADIIYPAINRELYQELATNGLILSEYSPGTKPEAKNFPIRNRIISGLSLGVLVVEAALRSGSLITAKIALEQNREVYAVPGATSSGFSRGCQELIRHGAQPVFSAEDILADLSPLLHAYNLPPEPKKEIENETATEAAQFGNLDDNAKSIATLLKVKGPRNADQISEELGLSASEAQSLLVQLEMEGVIARLPGLRFRVCF